MATKNTTKVSEKVEIPNIASENLSDTGAWTLATSASAGFGKNAEVIFRSVGFLAGVVILTETSQKEVIEVTGVNASALSKAKKCLVAKATELAGSDTVTVEVVADALECLIAEFGSIEEAYKWANGDTEKKEVTLDDMCANLYKWGAKNGYSDAEVLKAMALMAERRAQGE